MKNENVVQVDRSKEDWMKDIIEYYEFYNVDQMVDECWFFVQMIVTSKSFQELEDMDQCNYIFQLRLLSRLQKAVWEVFGDEIGKQKLINKLSGNK